MAPYDAPMDSSAVVTPPYVAGPLQLAPFTALRMAPSRIGSAASARAFARPYRTVRQRLTDWEAKGLLVRDCEPAVYLHEYTANAMTVRGLVGTIDLTRRATDPGDRAILPHEGIHPLQADDLADRMWDMRLNPAPILLVQRSPAEVRAVVHRTMSSAPAHDFVDRREQRHRVWPLRSPEDLRLLDSALAGTRALIADGHHRYAAYLRLHRRHPTTQTGRGLAMLVDQDDTPLFLGPIHRVLGGVGLDDLHAAVQGTSAELRETTAAHGVTSLSPDVLVVTDGQRWADLRLGPHRGRAAVEVLHDEIVPALPRGPLRITHHHTAEEALTQVRRRPGCAVLLPAPDVDLVLHVAGADRLLPEKATSFQPKPSLGVLIRSLSEAPK